MHAKSSLAIINGLSQIAPDYDAAICDVWGVVHNGKRMYAPAIDAMRRFRAERGPVVLVSNAPRPPEGVIALFDKLSSVTSAVKGRDKRIGACVDCGHFLRSGEDPVKCVLELSDRVYGVHIKDEKETNTPKSDNVVIGKGHLDVVGLFKALRQIKFPADGALSLEYEANPMNPIDDMKACLEIAKEAIAKSA